MRTGFVQFMPQFGDIDGNLEKMKHLTSGIDADLVVFPELCTSGYLFRTCEEVTALSEEIPGGKTTETLVDIARNRGMTIVAGIAERSGDRFYNSAVLVTPEGYRATYRKIHLFHEEKQWFAPGDEPFAVYDIGICRLGMMICFDWLFPESMRVLALNGADIVCHPANLVLPYCQAAMVTRCLENRVFAITANRVGTESRGTATLAYTGGSQITGHDGTVLLRASEAGEETGVVTVDIAAAREKRLTPLNDLFDDRRPEFYEALAR